MKPDVTMFVIVSPTFSGGGNFGDVRCTGFLNECEGEKKPYGFKSTVDPCAAGVPTFSGATCPRDSEVEK